MMKCSTKWSLVLPLLAFFSLTVSALPTRRHGHKNLPVCILGAGPAGLSAAARLEDKGIEAVVFDRQEEVGGKCQAWYDDQYVFHSIAQKRIRRG